MEKVIKNIAILFFVITSSVCWGQNSNLLLADSCILKPDLLDGQEVYVFIDTMPEFPDGESMMLAYLMKNLRYPKDQEEFQGSIHVTFVVDTTGQTRNVCIFKRYFKNEISKWEMEALNVVNKMPKWKPGQKNGQPVPVRIYLPIRF